MNVSRAIRKLAMAAAVSVAALPMLVQAFIPSVSDSCGVIDWDWSYETVPNRYTFQGREYDAERGDYHFRNRVYMPEWGLFSGPDMNLAAGPYWVLPEIDRRSFQHHGDGEGPDVRMVGFKRDDVASCDIRHVDPVDAYSPHGRGDSGAFHLPGGCRAGHGSDGERPAVCGFDGEETRCDLLRRMGGCNR